MSTNNTNVSSPAASPAGVYVGIDVAQDKLDLVMDDAARVLTFANDSAGIMAIIQLLKPVKPACVVIESTGGLERPLLESLLENDLPTSLVHPGRVRYFAKGLGILSKTDRIDARVLRRFGQLASPRLTEKRSKNEAELQSLVACRRQLNVTRVQQKNRLTSTSSKPARRSIEKVIETLDKQINLLDKQIRELINADDDFKHLDQLLQSVPGVGPTLSATLAAELRELGQADRQQIGALVGVAPYNHDSGKFAGQRCIRGGRTSVRCVLYMATVASIRFNPIIKAMYDRLTHAGKKKKVAIVACMRKLFALLNAMIREGVRWDQLNVVKNLSIAH
jgi:transposase